MQVTQGIFVTGTDTNVGKTWIAEQIIPELRRLGFSVIAKKPVESGWQTSLKQTDAGRLAKAVGFSQSISQICRYHFEAAISPPRAAFLEKRSLSVQQLVIASQESCASDQDFLWVEGAGGFYSPLTDDGLNADLAQYLQLPILLVAEDRLGCINQVLLSLEAIQRRKLFVFGILLNKMSSQKNSMHNAEDLLLLQNRPVWGCNNKSKTIFQSIAQKLVDFSV